ncbi:hypothetical protein H5154_20270 [Pseudoalteromonas sp. SR44-5]|uniref:hypothetical protein n=1 Tax=Pseudoalteromonas sp. SR44-5 TaxID=2760934 RepID=UPI001602CA8F|nr:hypothetical protein [Pseudoalteromonas sp. SR44-5]MBB1368679.1 hypothetical protein [Pseudoalteromonas sp. SR44-5]
MQTNLDFTKTILEAIKKNDDPFFDLATLRTVVCKDSNDIQQLVFQIQIFFDEGIISRFDGRKVSSHSDIGIAYNGLEPTPDFTGIRLRLTSKGQDYSNALQNSDIFSQLKERMKDAPINTICNMGPKLLESFAKKKFEELIM